VPEGADPLRDDARKVLAWEDIADEEMELRLDDGQKRQFAESLKKAQRDIKETVWRTYKNVMLLGKDGEWKTVDLGLVHSSSAPSIGQLMIERLGQAGDIEEKGVSPNFLVRNWPPVFKEWNTRSVRDAFFASPQFPRLLNPDSIKDTIARGVENGMLGTSARRLMAAMFRSTGRGPCYPRTSKSPTTSSSSNANSRRRTKPAGTGRHRMMLSNLRKRTTPTRMAPLQSPMIRRTYRQAFLASCGVETSRTTSG
jgi:hypothetical protein